MKDIHDDRTALDHFLVNVGQLKSARPAGKHRVDITDAQYAHIARCVKHADALAKALRESQILIEASTEGMSESDFKGTLWERAWTTNRAVLSAYDEARQ